MRRRSRCFPWRCPHGRRSAGQSAGRVWNRKGRRQKGTRRKTERGHKQQTINRSPWMALRWYECALADTCALARLEPCSEYAHNQTRAMRMSKMTCEVYLSTYFKQHALRSGSFLNFCQPHPGPHVSLWKFFPSTVWTSWILSKILITFYSRPHSNNHLYDFLSTRPDLCVWTLLHHVFLWNRECFFLGHTELNSRFIVMTINEVTFDWPEVFPGFGVICCFCGLRLSPIRLWSFSLKTYLFSACSSLGVGSRNSSSLPDNFAVPSATRNMNSFPFCVILSSFALILRR